MNRTRKDWKTFCCNFCTLLGGHLNFYSWTQTWTNLNNFPIKVKIRNANSISITNRKFSILKIQDSIIRTFAWPIIVSLFLHLRSTNTFAQTNIILVVFYIKKNYIFRTEFVVINKKPCNLWEIAFRQNLMNIHVRPAGNLKGAQTSHHQNKQTNQTKP